MKKILVFGFVLAPFILYTACNKSAVAPTTPSGMTAQVAPGGPGFQPPGSGNQWQTVGNADFSIGGGSATTVSLALSNGQPYVAYQDAGNGNKMTVVTYSGGSTWTPVGTAGFTAGQASMPSIYVNNGTPYVAFIDGNYGSTASVMTYNGTSWGYVGNPAFSGGQIYNPSLAGSGSTLYLAYSDGGNGQKLTVMTSTGSNFSALGGKGFTSDIAGNPSIAVYNGTPYVAFVDGANGSKISVMKYSGSYWTKVGTAGFSGGVAQHPSLGIYNGTLYVAYTDNSQSGKATVMTFNGSSWVLVGNAGFSGVAAVNPSLAIDATSGALYVGYAEDHTGTNATVMTYNGSAWVAVGGPDFSGVEILMGQLAVSGGYPFVAYDDINDQNKVSVMEYAPAYTPTNTATPTNTPCVKAWNYLGGPGVSPAYANAEQLSVFNGIPYLAYFDVSQNTSNVLSFDGTSWTALGGNPGFPSVGGQSFFLYNGTPYLAFSTTTGIHVEQYNGSAWTQLNDPGINVYNNPYGYSTFSLFVFNNVPYLAYSDPANQRMCVIQYTGGSWGALGSPSFSATVAGNPSLYVTNGQAYVAYDTIINNIPSMMVMNYSDGSWTPLGAQGISAYCSCPPHLVIHNGTPYLAVSDYRYEYKASVLEYNGSAWTNVGAPGFSPNQAYPKIAFDNNNVLYAIYSYQQSNLSFSTEVRYLNGNDWFIVANGVFSGGAEDICVDLNNVPYLAYGDVPHGYKASVMKLNICP